MTSTDMRSRADTPFTTSRAMATSAKVRAIGPRVEYGPHVGAWSSPEGTTLWVGLNPANPHAADGIRIDPPPSDPVARGTMAAATAAAEPPLEPPQERAGAHGLPVAPNSRFSVSARKPYAGVLVFPITTAPAARSRATCTESREAGGSAARAGSPWVVTNPAASSRSFTPTGTPASGPGSSPAAMRSASAWAWRRAPSTSRATNARTTTSTASMRARAASTISTGDRSPERTDATSSASDSAPRSIGHLRK
ncbi:MAG: hypothetical protein M5U14_04485 [Acidimicrobiia bacterium]|nr:hypothetical protein [Acidimicrobiia bacterium]